MDARGYVLYCVVSPYQARDLCAWMTTHGLKSICGQTHTLYRCPLPDLRHRMLRWSDPGENDWTVQASPYDGRRPSDSSYAPPGMFRGTAYPYQRGTERTASWIGCAKVPLCGRNEWLSRSLMRGRCEWTVMSNVVQPQTISQYQCTRLHTVRSESFGEISFLACKSRPKSG